MISGSVHTAFGQPFLENRFAAPLQVIHNTQRSVFSRSQDFEFLFYYPSMCCFTVDGNVDATTFKLKRKNSHRVRVWDV